MIDATVAHGDGHDAVSHPMGSVQRVALVTLTVTVAAQMARLFFPIVFDWGERTGTTIAAVKAGGLAVLVFLAPLLAPTVRNLLGKRGSLWGSIAAIAVLRIAVQLVHPVPLWLAALGTAAGLVAVSLLLVAVRSGAGSEGGQEFVVGVILGLALDTALRTAFWTWDYVWQGGGIPMLLAAVTSAGPLLLVSVGAGRHLEAASEGGAHENFGAVLIGPFLFLQVLFIQSVAFVASSADIPVPAASSIVLLGDALAMAAVTWAAGQEAPRPARMAGAVALIAATYLLRSIQGEAVVVAVLVAHAVAAPFLLMGLSRPQTASLASVRRTSGALALGSFGFMLFLVLYQIHYRVPLPFPNKLLLPATALVLALGGLGGREMVHWAPGLRRGFLVALPLVLLIVPVGAALARPEDKIGAATAGTVRLVSYNVHLAIDADGQLDPEGIASIIEAGRPDVVALQEVPRGWAGAGTMDLAEWLSQRLRMPYRFAPAADRQFGNVILSRLPIVRTEAVSLPKINGAMRRSYVLVAVSMGGGRRLTVIDAHLEGSDPDHYDQTQRLLADWSGAPHTVIAGDMNMQPDDPDAALFEGAGFVSAQDQAGQGSTATASHPKFPGDRVDWIFGTNDVAFSSFGVGSGDASDHLPLQVTITLA